MLIVLLSGSPSASSRSAALLEHARAALQRQGYTVETVGVRDFPAEDLLLARFDQPSVQRLISLVDKAHGLVVATPVYKAAYAGALKLLLDVLPERALENKVVLPIASGGSPAHMLILDYALKPVLSALNVKEVLQGVYAVDQQIQRQADGSVVLDKALSDRLERAVEAFGASLRTQYPAVVLPQVGVQREQGVLSAA